jgi:hypothetical protein
MDMPDRSNLSFLAGFLLRRLHELSRHEARDEFEYASIRNEKEKIRQQWELLMRELHTVCGQPTPEQYDW